MFEELCMWCGTDSAMNWPTVADVAAAAIVARLHRAPPPISFPCVFRDAVFRDDESACRLLILLAKNPKNEFKTMDCGIL